MTPIFIVEKDGNSLRFWCPYCLKYHTHGDANGNGEGHRVAHCTEPTSPFKKTGYILAYSESRAKALRKGGEKIDGIC